MSPTRRQSIIAIADGDFRCLPYLHQLDSSPKRMHIYAWFLKRKITGAKFYTFFEERNFSVLRVLKFVLSDIEGKPKTEIIAGKDF